MSMLLAMVVLLLVDALLASWRRYDDEKAVSHIRGSLGRLEEAAKRAEKQINASVSKPPSSIEDYKALYSGFTGMYSAFNPSYTNEGKPGLRNDKLIDEIFYPKDALPVTDFWKGDREWSTWLKKSGRGSGAGS